METEWKLGNSGQISYMHALIDLMDFRKFQGVSSSVLQNFAVVEMFIKRARRCITKKIRMRFSTELDLETLERKGHWATIKELQQVIPYHLPRYKKVIELCKSESTSRGGGLPNVGYTGMCHRQGSIFHLQKSRTGAKFWNFYSRTGPAF